MSHSLRIHVMRSPSEAQHARSDNALIPSFKVPHFRAIPLNSSRLVVLYTGHVYSCKLACMYV